MEFVVDNLDSFDKRRKRFKITEPFNTEYMLFALDDAEPCSDETCELKINF